MYMWNLKYGTDELIYETEIDSQTYKTNVRLPGAKGVREGQIRSLGLADTNQYVQTKQQGPNVQHRELYSLSCNKNHDGKGNTLMKILSIFLQ